MPYLDRPCLTPGCGGQPFEGETSSPGYCDSCHVDRMIVADSHTCVRCGEVFEHHLLPRGSNKQCQCPMPGCDCRGVDVVCGDCEEEIADVLAFRRGRR